MTVSANTALDARLAVGDDGGVLLPRLVNAIEVFRIRTMDPNPEPMWSIAARAKMAPSQFSAILKAARGPEEEGAKVRSVEVASAERIAEAVDCELMVVPKSLVADVEKLIARGPKRGGRQ